jgi:hypothetical protein
MKGESWTMFTEVSPGVYKRRNSDKLYQWNWNWSCDRDPDEPVEWREVTSSINDIPLCPVCLENEQVVPVYTAIDKPMEIRVAAQNQAKEDQGKRGDD